MVLRISPPSNGSGRRIAHISPHPDDEAIGAPGTLLRMRDSGWSIHNFVVSMGRPAQQGRRRKEAATAAARARYDLSFPSPSINLSLGDNLEESLHRCHDELVKFLVALRPQIVIGPSPHDGHHAHELVSQALLRALASIDPKPRLWLWGIWADLPFPSLFVPFSGRVMDEAQAVVSCYEGEVDRNNYVALVRSRSVSNAVLGFERVFGFGEGPDGDYEFADVLTECIALDGRWSIMKARCLDPSRELVNADPDQGIDWWLESPSPHFIRRKRKTATTDSMVR